MAVTFNVTDMLADIAYRANVPPFTATTRTTLTQATYLLVQAARGLSGMFRQKFGDDHDYLLTATSVVPANVGLASLPANFGELHAVLWMRSSTDYRLLEASDLDDLENAQTGDLGTWEQRGQPRYDLEGETLTFYPPSSAAENILVFYTRHLDIAGETTMQARIDSDAWCTLKVAETVIKSEGRAADAATLTEDRLMLETNLFSVGRRRDTTGTATIRDVRGRKARKAHEWPF